MITKYYNPKRGDIIFNPFDARGMAWDFWTDCATREDLERFSKILIGFKISGRGLANSVNVASTKFFLDKFSIHFLFRKISSVAPL